MGNTNMEITENSIKKLHLKYTRGENHQLRFDITWTHSQIIREIALQFIAKLENTYGIAVDKQLVEAGALLHDIGVYTCFDEELYTNKDAPAYIRHGIEGGDILRQEGFAEKYIRFAEIHTGTGITKEDIERENLPLPHKDYIPITLEEEILTYADKFHTKYPAFCTFEEQKKTLEKFDPIKGVKMELFKKKFGLPDLTSLQEKYASWHKEVDQLLSKMHTKQYS